MVSESLPFISRLRATTERTSFVDSARAPRTHSHSRIYPVGRKGKDLITTYVRVINAVQGDAGPGDGGGFGALRFMDSTSARFSPGVVFSTRIER